jgi:RNA polymerase sigma-70 factor (ECF subfamily)
MSTSDFDFLEQTLPHIDLVYNLARRSTRNHQDAEDLVQETYLRALKSWRSHGSPGKVAAWLAAICLNVVRSDYRRRSRRPAEELQAEPGLELSSGSQTEEAALGLIERAAVRRALAGLPEEQRIALVLVDIGGFTAAETARITRSPRATVLSRVHRGRKALARASALRQATKNET